MPKWYLEGHFNGCRCAGCRERKNAAARAEYARNNGKQRMRSGHLKRTYGITAEQYEWLAERQNNLCAICGRPETKLHKSGEPYQLAVDHDHQTGNVRGLLCNNCNQAIGLLEDDTDRLGVAIRYLHRQPPRLPLMAVAKQLELRPVKQKPSPYKLRESIHDRLLRKLPDVPDEARSDQSSSSQHAGRSESDTDQVA